MFAKIKAALARSRTIAWLAITAAVSTAVEASPLLFSILSMPEVSQIVQAYRPGYSVLFACGVGILARLRTLNVEP